MVEFCPTYMLKRRDFFQFANAERLSGKNGAVPSKARSLHTKQERIQSKRIIRNRSRRNMDASGAVQCSTPPAPSRDTNLLSFVHYVQILCFCFNFTILAFTNSMGLPHFPMFSISLLVSRVFQCGPPQFGPVGVRGLLTHVPLSPLLFLKTLLLSFPLKKYISLDTWSVTVCTKVSVVIIMISFYFLCCLKFPPDSN